jgi:hypothetical protein
MKKIIIIISILLATCVCFIIIVNIVAMLPVELHDEDLLYRPRQIDDDKNASTVLLPALKKMEEEKLDEQLKSFLEDGFVNLHKHEDVFQKSLPYFEAFDKAMKLDTMQFPADYLYGVKNPAWRLQDIMNLGKLEYSYIRKFINENNIVRASEEAEKFLKYGYLLQNSALTLPDQAIAMVVKGMAISSIQELAKAQGMDSALCGQLVKSVQKYGDNSGMVESLKGEYTFIKNYIRIKMEYALKDKPEALERYRKTGRIGWRYNENAAFDKIAYYQRQAIKNTTGKYKNIQHQRLRSIEKRFPAILKLLMGSPVGRLVIGTALKPEELIKNKFQRDARINLTITLLALRAYVNDNKVLPAQLNDLVPIYLTEIPEDPFDNKKLSYVPGQKIIYSVGFDMKDNQGDKKKDIIVDIAFPQFAPSSF